MKNIRQPGLTALPETSYLAATLRHHSIGPKSWTSFHSGADRTAFLLENPYQHLMKFKLVV
jgi:hypothetical protein